MRVLHITNWFPTYGSPYSALWIKRHIHALNPYCENKTIHLEVVKGRFSIRWGKTEIEGNKSYVVSLPFQIWLITELTTFFLLCYVLVKERKKHEVVNFHIAYPICTYLHIIKNVLKTPVVITEHWSAYHFNFGVKKTEKLSRIKNIFSHADRVITVSGALRKDIINFVGDSKLPIDVVPNVVDKEIFKYEDRKYRSKTSKNFFIVSQWKYPKDPIKILKAFMEVLKVDSNVKLYVGGYGPLETDIKKFIFDMEMEKKIVFLGRLSSLEIAHEMRSALAFIHLSEYETFSVVCAEAYSCGCPVIASRVGGILEYINDENGWLVDTYEDLVLAMQEAIQIKKVVTYDDSFHAESVGKKYFNCLKMLAK